MRGYSGKRAALARQAARQGGYFTAQQAIALGYLYPQQHYHVSTGSWERVARGVYRLRDFPQVEHADLIIVSLLSLDRAGQPRAVVSHETALALHDLGDANPARIYLTTPPGFRRQMPPVVVMSHAHLEPYDSEERDGFRVTTPLRTLCDIAASPESWPYLDAAVRDALRMGMVRPRQLLSAPAPTEARARLAAVVAAAEEKAGA